jgi:uncharacterized protein YjlB
MFPARLQKMETAIAPRSFFLTEGVDMPNNPHLPVLIYAGVLDTQTADKDKIFQRRFEHNGWHGVWKNGIFNHHHFHSNAHEALGIARGHVEIQLGGRSGKTLTLNAGDLVVLPAGTGHRRVSSSENYVVVGAYPVGQENYDMCHSRFAEARERIAKTALPLADPFYGPGGPLQKLWKPQ